MKKKKHILRASCFYAAAVLVMSLSVCVVVRLRAAVVVVVELVVCCGRQYLMYESSVSNIKDCNKQTIKTYLHSPRDVRCPRLQQFSFFSQFVAFH